MISKTTIIIPTLNEEENIGAILTTLKRLYPKIKIIVTDDGSKDKTQAVVKKFNGVLLVDRTNKLHGLTASILDALRFVKTPNVVIMDADFQHPPEKVLEIIKKLETHDLVIGIRRKIKEWWLFRRLISKIANLLAYIRLLHKGIKCKDAMSGFFGIKTTLLKKMDYKRFELRGFKILFDILKACPKNIKIGYIYYTFQGRRFGKSKLNTKQTIYFLKSLFR